MAGTFEVGSILARLGVDDTGFIKGLRNALQQAKQVGGQIKQALKPARDIKLDTRTFRSGLRHLVVQIRTFSRAATRAFKAAGRAITTALAVPLRLLRATFTRLAATARLAARRIFTSFSGLRTLFARIRRLAFGLTGALAAMGIAFGGFALIQRAREVEALRGAFEGLTASIGGTADTMLTKLRVATRSTVSNMQLMKTTNAAVLLGVVRSEDEFAELAMIARRLGSAVGRDAVDAINDLSIGIGRQSRLILDNLGLIVHVAKASEVYAARQGKVVSALTDAEKRQAFFNAAMEAGRIKIKQLGPDLVTLNDQWGRFTASISNTVTIIAEAFVGGGPFAGIADFLEENQRAIGAWARLVSRTISNFVAELGRLFASLADAGSFKEAFEKFSDLVVDAITSLLSLASTFILKGIELIVSRLGWLMVKLLAAFLASFGNKLLAGLANVLDQVQGVIAKGAIALVGKGLSFVGIVDEESVKQTILAVDDLLIERERGTVERAKQRAKEISAIVETGVQDVSSEIQGLAKEITKTFDLSGLSASGNRFAQVFGATIDSVGDNFKRMKLELADPFSGFKTLRVQIELQKVATAFNEIIRLREVLIETAPKLIDKDELRKSGADLEKFRDQITELNKVFAELKKAPEGARAALQTKFLAIVEKVTAGLKKNVEASREFATEIALNLDELIDNKALAEFQDQLDGLNLNVDLSIDAFNQLSNAARATVLGITGIDQFNRELDKVAEKAGLTEEQLEDLRLKFNDLIRDAELSAGAMQDFGEDVLAAAKQLGFGSEELDHLRQDIQEFGRGAGAGAINLKLLQARARELGRASKIGAEGFKQIFQSVRSVVSTSLPHIQTLRERIEEIATSAGISSEGIEKLRQTMSEVSLGLTGVGAVRQQLEELGKAAGLSEKQITGLVQALEAAVDSSPELQVEIANLKTLITGIAEAAGAGSDELDQLRRDIENLGRGRGVRGIDKIFDSIQDVVTASLPQVQSLRERIEEIATSAGIGSEGVEKLRESLSTVSLGFFGVGAVRLQLEALGRSAGIGEDKIQKLVDALDKAVESSPELQVEIEKLKSSIGEIAEAAGASSEGLDEFRRDIQEFGAGAGVGAVNLGVLKQRTEELAQSSKIGAEGFTRIFDVIRAVVSTSLPQIQSLRNRIEAIASSAGISEEGIQKLRDTMSTVSLGLVGIGAVRGQLKELGNAAGFSKDEVSDLVKALEAAVDSSPQLQSELEKLGGLFARIAEGAGLGSKEMEQLRQNFQEFGRGTTTQSVNQIFDAIQSVVSTSIPQIQSLRKRIESIAQSAGIGEEGIEKLRESLSTVSLGFFGVGAVRLQLEDLGRSAGIGEDGIDDLVKALDEAVESSPELQAEIKTLKASIAGIAEGAGASSKELKLLRLEVQDFGRGAGAGAANLAVLQERAEALARSSKIGAEGFSQIFDGIRAAVSSSIPQLQSLRDRIEAIATSAGIGEEGIQSLRETMATVGLGIIGLGSVQVQLEKFGEAAGLTGDQIKALVASVEDAVESSPELKVEVEKLQAAITGIAEAAGIGEEGIRDLQAAVETFGIGTFGLERLQDKTIAFAEASVDASASIRKLRDAINEAGERAGVVSPRLEAFRKQLDRMIESGERLPDFQKALAEALKPTFLDLEQFSKLILPFTEEGAKIKALTLEVRTIGLTEAQKELVKFESIFEKLIETGQLSPEQLQRVEKARRQLAELLDQRENAKGLDVAKKALEKFDAQLDQLRDTASKVEIGALAVQFQQLDRALDDALSKAPAEAADEIREKFQRMAEALAEVKISEVTGQLRELQTQLGQVGASEAEQKIRALTAGFEQFRESVRGSVQIEIPAGNRLLDVMRQKVLGLQQAVAQQDFERAFGALADETRKVRNEMALIGSSEDQQRLAEVRQQIDFLRQAMLDSAEALLVQAEAAGASKEELAELIAKVKAYREQFEAGATELEVSVKASISKENAQEAAAGVANVFEKSIGQALVNALRRGESIGKQWSQILAGFFSDAMSKAVERIGKFIEEQLGSIFNKLEVEGGIGGMIGGLLGVAGMLYQNLKSRSTTTIEDFSEAVNSSEAVRGVVAGPTNVAISKVGDSLKQALRTTEILLERIAISVEGGIYGGGGGGPGPGGGELRSNAVLPLTTSTAS